MNFQTENAYSVCLTEELLRSLRHRVAAIYRQIDARIADMPAAECRACGACCDFQNFGHRLFLTPPELIYFDADSNGLFLPMSDGVCPYQKDGRCAVYPRRFAACRIFFCRANTSRQQELSEYVLRQLKEVCLDFGLDYRYWDLRCALSINLTYTAQS